MAEPRRSGGARPADKESCTKCGQTVNESAVCPKCEGQPTDINSKTQIQDVSVVQDNKDTEKPVNFKVPASRSQSSNIALSDMAFEKDQAAGDQSNKQGALEAGTGVQPDNVHLGHDACGMNSNHQVAPTSGQGNEGSAGSVVLQGEELIVFFMLGKFLLQSLQKTKKQNKGMGLCPIQK